MPERTIKRAPRTTAPSSRGLASYRSKRRFDVTGEPSGADPPSTRRGRGLRFVVQKHRATRLHYDFRLEWQGVLLSWAVPKGPSLDPSVKRMAVAVEDHPLAYADFEGIIPAGEYGGGTVMVWDRGRWTPDEADVAAALRKGELKFTLAGKKLKGSWVLVRTRYDSRDAARSRSWLLIKHRDAAASTEDVTAIAPRSVKSKRLLAEIAIADGGDVAKAASGDPPADIAALMRTIEQHPPKRRRTPSVWHSRRSAE